MARLYWYPRLRAIANPSVHEFLKRIGEEFDAERRGDLELSKRLRERNEADFGRHTQEEPSQ